MALLLMLDLFSVVALCCSKEFSFIAVRKLLLLMKGVTDVIVDALLLSFLDNLLLKLDGLIVLSLLFFVICCSFKVVGKELEEGTIIDDVVVVVDEFTDETWPDFEDVVVVITGVDKSVEVEEDVDNCVGFVEVDFVVELGKIRGI